MKRDSKIVAGKKENEKSECQSSKLGGFHLGGKKNDAAAAAEQRIVIVMVK